MLCPSSHRQALLPLDRCHSPLGKMSKVQTSRPQLQGMGHKHTTQSECFSASSWITSPRMWPCLLLAACASGLSGLRCRFSGKQGADPAPASASLGAAKKAHGGAVVTRKAAVHAAAKGKPQPADGGATAAASKSAVAAAAKSAEAGGQTAANGIAKEAKVKPAKQKAAPKPAAEDKPVDISRSVLEWQA